MVTAMKPRQILLSCSSLSTNGKPLSLTADQKPVLLQAVCLFLESNGFPKTLKKFLSEASIEKESWKSCLLNLEDACCMYLTARSENDAGETNITSDKTSEKIVDTDANIKSKDKKKKKGEKETTEVVESEVAITQEKSSKKAKDKKKKKGTEATTEPLSENLQTPCVEKENKDSTDPEKNSKPKSERKKNKDSKIENDEVNVDQDKKSSKKRKKSSEENKIDDLKEESEVIKCRKTCDSGDEGTDKQVTKAINKDLENELVDNGGDKSALSKSSAKKENGSEPRSKNETFHRVKTDDVEFADDRLKDNSYWAKDGAEIGYGAKAQEVLGQVRGRDFRHEKTKKKRGSYRGGLIDLQSHSVKFNYSEEEDE